MFFTPSLPPDLDLLSRPATYLTWSAKAIDGGQHDVDLLLDVSPMVAVNERAQPVTWGRASAPGLDVLRVGSRDQDYVHQSGDRIRIDWGYFDLGVPQSAAAQTELSAKAMAEFVGTLLAATPSTCRRRPGVAIAQPTSP